MGIQYYWLIVGGLCIAAEALGVSGIGFLFAGLAAASVALLMEAGGVAADHYFVQLVWFMGFTALWGALLWKPLKKMRVAPSTTKQGSFSNIVGEMAVVAEGGLRRGQVGSVSWSGTIMMAELAPHCQVVEVARGERVRILAVEGAKLIVDVVE